MFGHNEIVINKAVSFRSYMGSYMYNNSDKIELLWRKSFNDILWPGPGQFKTVSGKILDNTDCLSENDGHQDIPRHVNEVDGAILIATYLLVFKWNALLEM